MKNGICCGSSERVGDELRLQSCSPLCFFAFCVASAIELADFEVEDDDEEEEEEEEEEDEEVGGLGEVGINLALESTFINCL